jgi:polar amino acid transport system substrate-binding protein
MRFAYLIEPPFNYRSETGEVTGCDVELAKAILTKLGVTNFQPIETDFAELLPGVSDGRWRMTTGLFATEERRQLASFSRPIWALPDGLLVQKGNPFGLDSYRSVAQKSGGRLAVIRNQIQYKSAIDFGVPDDRIRIFETYTHAAQAVLEGTVDAYASVGRAHSGFIEQNRSLKLEVVIVPSQEKEPAFGSFAFAKDDNELRRSVDDTLNTFLGSKEHLVMMADFGFSADDVDLVARPSK